MIWLLPAALLLSAEPSAAEVRGDAAAVAASERLLAAVGGREAWADGRTFYVEERVFLRSGEVATLKIWRDMVSGARRLERITPSASFKEWLGPDGGYDSRNSVVRRMPADELALERRGLMQEPYAIYRRLALRDPAIRVELRDPTTLFVYDDDGQVLCWFLLDQRGALVSWANFYDGAINQHFYGPMVDVGDANLPKWGASPTGFRFEYVSARFLPEAVTQPTP